MVAVNYSNLRSNLKDYCDRATNDGEVVVVTRKKGKNVVIISLADYTEMEKQAKNAAYMEKIHRGFEQVRS